jgi:ADP-heptose:LPS heptosyltransferase
MKKYLIFRTDRIGDFITSQIISNSIKQKSNKNQIDFVVSKYNYEYIKNFKYISNIYIFNKTGLKFLDIILLYIKVRDKYDFLIVLDGKRRSLISGIFISSFKKICFMKGFYSKILTSLFYDKYIKNDKRKYQYKNFETLLNYLNLKIPKQIKYYDSYKFKTNKFNLDKPYMHLHLDEKWFENYYYNDFDFMNLNEIKIYEFISYLVKIFKINLVITQGHKKIKIMQKFKSKYLNLKKNINTITINNKKIIFYDNTDFRDLENLVRNTKLLICCEGAISHVSHAFGIKTIALYQKNRPDITYFWTNHMKNIKLIPRSDIKHIKNKLKKISNN